MRQHIPGGDDVAMNDESPPTTKQFARSKPTDRKYSSALEKKTEGIQGGGVSEPRIRAAGSREQGDLQHPKPPVTFL